MLQPLDGEEHIVAIVEVGLGRTITWSVADREVATQRTFEDRIVLDGGSHGTLSVRLPRFVGPARRVTWYPPDTQLGSLPAAHAGIGGVDLDPEPGSQAARREAWIRAHPHQYMARRAGVAAAGALCAILGMWLLGRIQIPWPDWRLPRIPWPDIPWPEIPWPDITIPWPDWHPPTVPEWARQIVSTLKDVWPVLLAIGIAQAEVRRRRHQDTRKRSSLDSTTEAATSKASEAPPRAQDRRTRGVPEPGGFAHPPRGHPRAEAPRAERVDDSTPDE